MAEANESRIEALLMLPWTILPSRDAAEGYFVIRVKELPSVIATGDTPEAVEADLWDSMRATFETYFEFGDPIPLPEGVQKYPWEEYKPTMVRKIPGRLAGSAWEALQPASTALAGRSDEAVAA